MTIKSTLDSAERAESDKGSGTMKGDLIGNSAKYLDNVNAKSIDKSVNKTGADSIAGIAEGEETKKHENYLLTNVFSNNSHLYKNSEDSESAGPIVFVHGIECRG